MSKFVEYLEEQDLYEFANLDDMDTGIKNIILHAYSQGDGKKLPHGARIKVSNIRGKYSNSDNFVLDIKTGTIVEGQCKLSNKELQQIRNWISLNREELISYWDSEGSMVTRAFLNSIKKV
jgi:hypothetical protein